MKITVFKNSLLAGGIISLALSAMTIVSVPLSTAYAAAGAQGPLALTTVPDVTFTPVPPATAIPPTAPGPGSTVTPAPTTPPSGGNSSPVFSDPYVLKTANSGQLLPGQTGQFTIVAGNKGGVAAVNVQVRDALENYFDLVSVTASPRGTVIVNGNSFIVDIGTLNPNELITIVVTVKVNANAKAGTCVNVATLNTTSAGEDQSNDIAYANCLMGEVIVPQTGADLTQGPLAIALLVLGSGLLLAGIWVNRRQAA